MKFSIMTSPRHVTSRICSLILMKFVQLCKIEFQTHFVHENFLIFDLFFKIITIIVFIYIYIYNTIEVSPIVMKFAQHM